MLREFIVLNKIRKVSAGSQNTMSSFGSQGDKIDNLIVS